MSTDLNAGPRWPTGVDLVVLDEVDSTMTEAALRVASIRVPTWIMAKRQTAGRGRRGKQWVDPRGNLAATLVYKPKATPQDAALRSFLAAVALFETLAFWVPRERLSLKWPNDVLLDGGKVAGILLESSGTAESVNWLSIGVGVNLATVPQGVEGAAFPPVSVSSVAGHVIRPKDFLSLLATNFITQENKLTYFGFERIRADWLRNAARLGETITARTAQETLTGIFDTIDRDGNLVLITGRGPVTISAADVHF
ncbi:biotin--[acetyl-CoA-carboxylase] ligase [Aestuarium zhoushanense]|nr:biotin--[acetyl-CoA-carboxylase] ligase [Aestuarium zhoushanense]